MRSYPVRVTKRGVITLPAPVRRSLKIREGSILTLLDLDGALVLVPQILETDRLADPLAAQWRAQGIDPETMLNTLREIRSESAVR
jgi:AbrB family looped-hinge helix DNA binding protein